MRAPSTQPLLRAIARCGVALACLAPQAAGGEEVQVSLRADNEYNSNVIGRESNELDSYLIRLGPVLEVRDPYGRLTYGGRYTGAFSWYANATGLDAYEQSLDVDGGLAISRRTQLVARNAFRDMRGIRFTVDEIDDQADTLDGERDRFLRNTLDVRLRHAFGPRTVGNIELQNDWIDFTDDEFRNDAQTMSARASLGYQVTPADTVGIGGGFAYQSFSDVLGGIGSRSRIWDASLQWQHVFDDSFSFALSGGPSLVQSRSDSQLTLNNLLIADRDPSVSYVSSFCAPSPDLPAGQFYSDRCIAVAPPASGPIRPNPTVRVPIQGIDPTSSDVTFFASAQVAKRWEDVNAQLRYSRAQSVVSGEGGASVRDTIRLTLDYRIDTLWGLYLGSAWTRRERLGNPVVPRIVVVPAAFPNSGFATPVRAVGVRRSRAAQNDQFTTIVGTSRRLSRAFTAALEFRHRYQAREATLRDTRRVQWFIVNLRLEYAFEPFRI